jgi:hypothetical protein
LRPSVFLPQRPNLRPDFFLDGLHQEQFGATLLLTILVITSMTVLRGSAAYRVGCRMIQ